MLPIEETHQATENTQLKCQSITDSGKNVIYPFIISLLCLKGRNLSFKSMKIVKVKIAVF